MKKIIIFFVFSFTFLIISNSTSAQSENNFKIGANLKKYSPPKKTDCNIKVPQEYSTIQAGINASTTGDKVCVDEGTYNEDVTVNKPITLSGNGINKKTIVVGQSPGTLPAVLVSADNVIVEGLEIRGVGTDYTNAALRIGESRSNIIIRYNHIVSGNGELALLADGFQNNNLIENNILEGNNSPQVALVYGQPSVSKPSDNVSFLYNTFIGTVNPTSRQDTGVILGNQSTNNLMQYNVFNTGGNVMEVVQNAYATGTKLNFNNFNSDAALWKVSNGVDVLNAENNWWGDLDPSDEVRNNFIDFTPFETSPFKENK